MKTKKATMRVIAAAVTAACGIASCGNDSGDEVAMPRENDASAAVEPELRVPLSIYDPGTPDAGLYCAFLVAAECDGPEDCAAGEVCCGTLTAGVAVAYDSMRCQPACSDVDGGIVMCHENTDCPGYIPADAAAAGDAGPGDVCRRSFVLPEYLTVCNPPSPFAPAENVKPSTAAGEVNCGRELICGPGEKCCVMASWDAATQATVPAPGYCAPESEECDCANVTQREY